MNTLRCSTIVATLLALSSFANAADDVCQTSPLWGQSPQFWDSTAPLSHAKARYDGRWAGAAMVPLDNGTSGARARILEGTDGALYVSFEIDTVAGGRNLFWFAHAPANATDSSNAWLLRVQVKTSGSNVDQAAIRCGAGTSCPTPTSPCDPATCGPEPLINYRFYRGVAPTSPGTARFEWDNLAFNKTQLATWMSGEPGSRAWHGPIVSTSASLTGVTVLLRIPNSELSPAAVSDRKIWLAAATCEANGAGELCSPQGSWPSLGTVDGEQVAGTVFTNMSQVADWALLHRTNTVACPAQGRLVAAGLQNGATGAAATYNSATGFTYPQRMYLDNNNNQNDDPSTFFAAQVQVPVATTANSITARYFIADWGSQIGNLSTSQWKEIGNKKNVGAAANTVEHIALRWPVWGETNAQRLQLACKYSKCDATVFGCPYPTLPAGGPNAACAPGGTPLPEAHEHHPHQCTQIRVESTTYQFAQDAMIFNTDFVGASVFWRIATISTEGIDKETPKPTPAPPEGRDIYIQVRPINLPNKVANDEYPAMRTVENLELIAKGVRVVQPPAMHSKPVLEEVFAKRLREQVPQNAELSKTQQEAVHQMLRRMPLDTVRTIAPTLEFHVYYDSGRILDNVGGKTARWIAPMTSFRYVVEHIGKVKGWEWALDGATPLGNNWFHIKLKDGEKRDIRTRVQAVENQHRMPEGQKVWPPGETWINQPGKPTKTTVKVSKKGGCAVAGGSGSASGLLVLAALLWLRRRRS